MSPTSGVFAMRTARPPPTQVAFDIPRARRIPLRSPPYSATTCAARDRTTVTSAYWRMRSSREWHNQHGSQQRVCCELHVPEMLVELFEHVDHHSSVAAIAIQQELP